MKASLTSLTKKSKAKQGIIAEIENAEKEQDKINAEYEQIRKTNQKKIVNEDIFYMNFSPNDCNCCMHYDDKTDGCKKGISYEQWNEMHINGNECEFWDYIYETVAK